MIGFLRGKVISKNEDLLQCTLLSHRIGFEVTIAKPLLDSLLLETNLSLWIHTVVREDAFSLYGFSSEPEKNLFRMLLSVSGLGPKTALSLLSEHGAEKLTRLIVTKNTDEIAEASGVGKKTAQRLVLELGTKIEKWAWLEKLQKSEPQSKPEILSEKRQLREDLASALIHLGYAPNPIKSLIEKLFENEQMAKESFEICLKTALKELSNRAIPSGELRNNG